MSPQEHEQSPAVETSSPVAAKSEQASFRLGRMVLIAGFCAITFVAVVYFLGVADGPQWLAGLMEPSRVAATGQVFYQGKPLPGGEVRTQSENASTAGAIGFLDDEGKFTLTTIKDGILSEGAYVGEYKVTIAMFGPQFAAGAKPITPEKYASFETTPLTLRVSLTAAENKFNFTLEDDPNAPPRKPGREPSQAAGDGPLAAGGPRRGPPSPDAIFQRLDKNKDDKITEDEAPAQFWGRMLEADANGDNAVSREEMTKAAEKRAGESRPEGEQKAPVDGEQPAEAEPTPPPKAAQPEPSK